MLPENGSQTSGNTPSHQWTTNLETIESVCLAGVEPVYDIEVEDNHNFVANGLLVHNCHMLSTAAFNALLKTLEEPPDRVIFVLATTDPQRVLPTIISRCQRFDFRRIPLEAMVMHLSQIADKEAIDITPEAIQLVAQISQGGLRDAEALLDQLSLLEGTITVERVWDLVGAVPERDLLALVKAIAVDDATTVLEQARRLMDRGREPLIVLQNLASFYRDLLIAKTSPDRPDLVAVTSPTWAEMTEFAQSLDLRTILQGQQRLRESEVQVKNTTQPRLWLEVTLMGLLPSSLGSSPTAIHGATAAPSTNHRSSSPVIAQVTAPRQAATQTRSEASLPRTHVQASPQQANLQANPVDRSPASNVKPQPESPSASSLPPEVISPVVQPEPEPIASLPDSPEPELNQADLEQIWQNVLAQIRFRGTQVLLQQQGCLLAFDGQQARIGIKSQPLFKMAKEKLPAIETAFAAIYEQRIVVSLEVTTAPPEPAAATEQQASTYTAPAPSAAPQRRSIVREAPPQPRETREPSPPSVPLPETAPAPFAEAESQSPVLNTAWKTDDEVSGAAKSLAMFFNGEIVNPDGEIVNPDSELSAEQRVDTTGLEVGEPDLDEIDGDPDDDVPF
ncbi:MAG: DNA polymerase III subunit gamma/tau [Elainellaceae cyanobacterium]